MAKPLKSILLATNLKEYNKVAFDVAASLCIHYKAKLILLHVLEKIPIQAESLLRGLMGDEQRDALLKSYADNARQALVGKNVTSAIIQSVLNDYCKNSGIAPAACGIASKEIIVCEGDVDENIISHSKEHDCGMIVMAAHEGLFSKSSISRIIKSVLKQSTIPVLTVPHVFK